MMPTKTTTRRGRRHRRQLGDWAESLVIILKQLKHKIKKLIALSNAKKTNDIIQMRMTAKARRNRGGHRAEAEDECSSTTCPSSWSWPADCDIDAA